MSNIHIDLAPAAQLVGVALAASDWPQLEQATLTHGTHPQTKATRQWVRPFAQHAAIRRLNELLAAKTAVSAIYAQGLEPTTAWGAALARFGEETAVLTQFWPQQAAVWQAAVVQLQAIIDTAKLADFLQKLTRKTAVVPLHISPNLLYPALTPVLAQTNHAWHLLIPPPKAVGESPPWPYAEDSGWVVAQLCQGLLPSLLGGLPLAPDERLWAITAVCLGQLVDAFEAQAYLLRMKKQHKLPHLPQLAAEVEEFLVGEREDLFD